MIEEIDFQDTDNRVSVTIDNETQRFSIKKINRLSTYIDLEQSLNTALENNIELKASIYYIRRNNENETIKLNSDGTVTITIYDGENIYYSENKRFIKGDIKDSIKNTLPLGSYVMTIEFAGNKYFEPSSLSVNFDVEKRLGTCTFKKERYYGEFTETIGITGTLKDSERSTAIKNCILNYDFNGETYTTYTNTDGEFNLAVTIPKPNITHCINYRGDNIEEINFEPGDLYQDIYEEEFKDDDGNIRKYSDIENFEDDTNNPITEEEEIEANDEAHIEETIVNYYPNATYLIDIYIDNDSYQLKNAQIEVIANKAPTFITINSVNTDTVSNILTVHGSVLATYNNTDNEVQYGHVTISLQDFNYQHEPLFITDGNAFSTNIDLVHIYSAYNTNDTMEIVPYDTTKTAYTKTTISGDTSAKVGDTFTVQAQVESTLGEPVTDGALIFTLFDTNNNLLYQYAVELDSTGLGMFSFSTSRKITYQIQAQYVGMFGYQDSQSEKFEVRVN